MQIWRHSTVRIPTTCASHFHLKSLKLMRIKNADLFAEMQRKHYPRRLTAAAIYKINDDKLNLSDWVLECIRRDGNIAWKQSASLIKVIKCNVVNNIIICDCSERFKGCSISLLYFHRKCFKVFEWHSVLLSASTNIFFVLFNDSVHFIRDTPSQLFINRQS